MSPIRVVEQAVEAEGQGEVTIRRDRGVITVKWVCGGARMFTADSLKEAIANADRVKEQSDLWLTLRDRNGTGFAVQIVDGYLTAVDGVQVADGGNGRVPWDELKKALKKAL